MKYTTITVKDIPHTVKNRFERECKKDGSDMSKVLRSLVKNYRSR